MIRRSLADLCRRLASWLEPSPIEEAIRRADDARAIRMEFEEAIRRADNDQRASANRGRSRRWFDRSLRSMWSRTRARRRRSAQRQ